jgi:23S rRNA pseudouridine1911/1915/1917 synthase
MQHESTLKVNIPPELDGYRLDKALALLFPDYSRTCLKTWIDQKKVWIDEQLATRARDLIRTGQALHLQPALQPSVTRWTAQAIPLDILDEDADLLLINKPAGLVVHPAPGHPDGTLVNALLHYLPQLEALPRAGLIHRLDRDTTGILVVSKTLIAYQSLVKQLEKRQIQRRYLAIVQGQLIAGGHIDLPIGRHPILRQKQAVVPINGKQAITDYRVLERFRRHTLLEVALTTGRTHQIRVHMAHLRYPVLGDPLYGGREKALSLSYVKQERVCILNQYLQQFQRQALHAYTLALQHPVKRATCFWKAPIPVDIAQLLTYLRADT